jgi:hypothetical protein
LLVLIDAAKYPELHGHQNSCQTVERIATVLTKDMMADASVSLTMMNLMERIVPDPTPAMTAPRGALRKRLEGVASKEWLSALTEATEPGK